MRRNTFARSSRKCAFTLVELLVVIGIIALLISILLPALNSARRTASTVKCASALKQVGIAFQMYANDNKGFWPAARDRPQPYPAGEDSSNWQAWSNLLLKYCSGKNAPKGIYSSGGTQSVAVARNTVIWGCPEWAKAFEYDNTAADYTATQIYPGYGMNCWAKYPIKVPAGTAYTNHKREFLAAFDKDATPEFTGKHLGYIKSTTWQKNGAMRGLLADSTLDVLIVQPHSLVISQGTYQWVNSLRFQPFDAMDTTQPCITVDARHLKRGSTRAQALHTPGLNMLFCDLHVAMVTPKQAYNALIFGQ